MSELVNITDEQIRQISERLNDGMRRPERTSWNRRIDLLIGIIAIVSLIFSAGINWTRMSIAETAIKENKTRLEDQGKMIFELQKDEIQRQSDVRILNEKTDEVLRRISDLDTRMQRVIR